MRGQHHRLCQFVQTHQFIVVNHLLAFGSRLDTRTQTVGQHHIVMAGNVSNQLRRLQCPRLVAIVDFRQIHTRMLNSAHQTETDALLVTGQSGKERAHMVIVERTAQTVTHLVAECTDTRHLSTIGLYRTTLFFQLRCLGCPALTVQQDGRVYFIQHSTDSVHRLDVMDSHQVKAETVQMVLLHPPAYRLQHELAHHWTLAGGLVAATGCISQTAILTRAVEVPGSRLRKVGMCYVVRMIIHHVQNDTYACFV